MDFGLSEVQRSWEARGRAVGRELAGDGDASGAIAAAARSDLLRPDVDLLAVAVAVEAMAAEHASAAIAFALHTAVLRSAGERLPEDAARLAAGEAMGAIALSSDGLPYETNGMLRGRAAWVAPLSDRGLVVVGARAEETVAARLAGSHAYAVRLGDGGVGVEPVGTAGLRGVVCGFVTLENARATPLGPTEPIMATVRILLAASGLGMGRRALRESMQAARAYGRTGAGGEQTVQGLLADAATELDAAMLLTRKAASAPTRSLAEASMAKLAATEATQRAVARATQMIGSESFRQGHVIESLSQDVRALELFAGRTEALREAVALETLPQSG